MFKFYFPENIYQNSSSFLESVIITLLGALIGALIGFWGAMHIQRRTEMRASIEKLTLLSNLIDDVLILIPEHIKSFDKLLNNIKLEPYETHSLERMPSTDLDRLIAILKEEVFSSIALVFEKDASVFYRNIRKSIDSAYLINIELLDVTEKRNASVNKAQYFVQNAYSQLISILTLEMHMLRDTDAAYETNPLYIYIHKLAIKENEIKKEAVQKGISNIGNFNSQILIPLCNECTVLFDPLNASRIIEIAKPATVRVSNMESNSLEFLSSFGCYSDQLNKEVGKLESYNITLKKMLNIG